MAPVVEWREARGVAYLVDAATGAEHRATCHGVAGARVRFEPVRPAQVAEPVRIMAPVPMRPAPVAPVVDLGEPDAERDAQALADMLADGERIDAERDAEAHAARRGATGAEWPEIRRAILAYGGIGPSPDFPRDWIPGDLYRANGKAPDLVAAEAMPGAPWEFDGVGNDSAMFDYLHRSWDEWQRVQEARRPRARRPAAPTRQPAQALAAPAPADLRAAVMSMARLVADVADLVATGAAPADLARQVADAARTLAEATP